jgi:hypothetical protein
VWVLKVQSKVLKVLKDKQVHKGLKVLKVLIPELKGPQVLKVLKD